MLYRNLNNTELKASVIALGTDSFGSMVSEAMSFRIMDKYTELGGNIIDTARVYASWVEGGDGASERTIGKWMKHNGNRKDIILSTKCAHPILTPSQSNSSRLPSDSVLARLKYDEMKEDLEKSLEALQTDYVDILWLHRDDFQTPVSEIADTLESFVSSKQIRYYGFSNWKPDRIEELNKYISVKYNGNHFIGSQIKWSLAETSPNYEEDPTLVEMSPSQYDYYKKLNLTVFAYASQAKGFFSKVEAGGAEALKGKSQERYYSESNMEKYKYAHELAVKHNVPISAIVLSYLYSNKDFNVIPIVGCKNTEQIIDSLSAPELII